MVPMPGPAAHACTRPTCSGRRGSGPGDASWSSGITTSGWARRTTAAADAEVARFGRVLRDAYAHVDRTVGELVAAFPVDTTIVLLSDHGMHAHHTDSDFAAVVDGRLERESGAS